MFKLKFKKTILLLILGGLILGGGVFVIGENNYVEAEDTNYINIQTTSDMNSKKILEISNDVILGKFQFNIGQKDLDLNNLVIDFAGDNEIIETIKNIRFESGYPLAKTILDKVEKTEVDIVDTIARAEFNFNNLILKSSGNYVFSVIGDISSIQYSGDFKVGIKNFNTITTSNDVVITNNTIWNPIISIVGKENLKPDLVPISLKINNTNRDNGFKQYDVVEIEVVIKNIGNQKIPKEFFYTVSNSEEEIVNTSGWSLDAGETKTLIFRAWWEKSIYKDVTFTLTIDKDNKIDESQEDNNTLEITVHCVPNCIDKDNGKNYNIKSKAYYKSNLEIEAEDFCIEYSTPNSGYIGGHNIESCSGSNCYLSEAICDNDKASYVNYTCPNGCKDGACVDSTQTIQPPIQAEKLSSLPQKENNLILKLERQISELEKKLIILEKKLTKVDKELSERVKGKMLLDVNNQGRLWYIDPVSQNRFYFENGASALSIGSKLATGISYENIQKIPIGIPDKLYNLVDTDQDGLPDKLEAAIGSDQSKSDTDGDGFSDKEEIQNNYDPKANTKYNIDQNLAKKLEGKMLLQVEGPNSHGEIWYVQEGKRWYGGTQDSMYEIMKARSLGATQEDIRKVEVGEVVTMN